MKKYIILINLFLFSTLIVYPQISDISKPRLVVFITIDGLKKDHLSLLYDRFKDNGFKRVINNGVYVQNIYFNYLAKNSVSDIASIYTGSTPSIHGITNKKLFSYLDNSFYSIVEDAKYYGLYTSVGRSPERLMTSTFTDVLKMYNSKSKVFAIGLNPENAIVMGGHNADGVVWIDDEGEISSSDFYKKIPLWAAELNVSKVIENYLKSSWMPMNSLSRYLYPAYNNGKGFYVPDASKSVQELVNKFRYTTYANSMVSRLAKAAIIKENLGDDDNTDVLSINYNVNTFFNQSSEFNSAEKEDLYLSLDRDLEILFKEIDSRVKMSNTLVIITGTQMEPFSSNTLNDNNIPTGKFESRRTMALLNAFLMAKYGQARWVLEYSQGNVFLNTQEMEKKDIDKNLFINEAVGFLRKIEGVNTVYSYRDLKNLSGDISQPEVRLKNSIFAGHSGDIILTLNAGWIDIDTEGSVSEMSSMAMQQVPLLIWGLNLEKQYIYQYHLVTDIAPTICNILQIPNTTSSMGKNILLKRRD